MTSYTACTYKIRSDYLLCLTRLNFSFNFWLNYGGSLPEVKTQCWRRKRLPLIWICLCQSTVNMLHCLSSSECITIICITFNTSKLIKSTCLNTTTTKKSTHHVSKLTKTLNFAYLCLYYWCCISVTFWWIIHFSVKAFAHDLLTNIIIKTCKIKCDPMRVYIKQSNLCS